MTPWFAASHELIDHMEHRFRAGLWVKKFYQVSARHVGLPVPSDNFVNDIIACCVSGAVQRDSFKIKCPKVRAEATFRVQNALDEEAVGRGFGCIEDLNDAPGTTQETMLDVLAAARNRLPKDEPCFHSDLSLLAS